MGHEDEGTSNSLDRAASLLADWNLDVSPDETDATKISHLKKLQAARPEEMLAYILEIFPELDEAKAAETFRTGVLDKSLDGKALTRTDEYAPVEELARFIGTASVNAHVGSDSPALNKYISDKKESLSNDEYQSLCLMVADIINKALVMRTLVFENFPGTPGKTIVEKVLAPIAAQLGDKSRFSYMEYEDLGRCLDLLKNACKNDDELAARIKQLIERHNEAMEEHGKHYNPHILVPVFIEGERGLALSISNQADLAESQIKYLEKVSKGRDAQKKIEARLKKEAEQIEKDREERERIERMEKELPKLLADIKELEAIIALLDQNRDSTSAEWKALRDVRTDITTSYKKILEDFSRLRTSLLKPDIFFPADQELERLITKVQALIDSYARQLKEVKNVSPSANKKQEKQKPFQLTESTSLAYNHRMAREEKTRLADIKSNKTEVVQSMQEAFDRDWETAELSLNGLSQIKEILESDRVKGRVEKKTSKADLYQFIKEALADLRSRETKR